MHSKRKVNMVVISDVHLGTYGSHAKELATYLESIEPKTLILNGDIIDMWQFNKRFFPKSHTRVLTIIMKMMNSGVKVHYITGNHDDSLRSYSPFTMGNLNLADKLLFTTRNGKKTWVFHGDVFDASVSHAKWIAKLGSFGYDLLIRLNRLINLSLKLINKPPVSISKKNKANIKNAVKFVNAFEKTAIELTLEQEYDYVICGHIHQPIIKEVIHKNRKTIYMNSGDWVENLTSLEYNKSQWSIYKYDESHYQNDSKKNVPYSNPFRKGRTVKNNNSLDLAQLLSTDSQAKNL